MKYKIYLIVAAAFLLSLTTACDEKNMEPSSGGEPLKSLRTRIVTKKFVKFDRTNGLHSNDVRKISVSGSKIYIVDYGGVSVSDDGGETFRSFVMAGDFFSEVYGIFFSDSNFYLATNRGVLRSLDPDGRSYRTLKLGIPPLLDKGFKDLWPLDCNTIYISDSGKIFSSTILPRALIISVDDGNSCTADALYDHEAKWRATIHHINGQVKKVYVSTSAGLAISEDEGNSFKIQKFSSGNNITQTFIADSRVYVASYVGGKPKEGGLYILEDGFSEALRRTVEDGLISNQVTAVFVHGNTVYAGTQEGISISYDQGLTFPETIDFPDRATGIDSFIRDIYADDRKIFAATSVGLYVIER